MPRADCSESAHTGWKHCWILSLFFNFQNSWQLPSIQGQADQERDRERERVLNLAGLQICVLRSFMKISKAHTKFDEALTKPYHDLIEILL